MNIQTFYLMYIDLSPSIRNKFMDKSHDSILMNLRSVFFSLDSFFEKYPNYSIGYTIVTKINEKLLSVKGPTISKKMEIIDFSIILPDMEYDISQYVDFIFEGILSSLKKYKIDEDLFLSIQNKCKQELTLEIP